MASDAAIVKLQQPGAGPDRSVGKPASRSAVLLQLEAEARRAESLKALQFLIANDTRRVVGYRQAYVLDAGHSRHRVVTISSLAVVERNAPALRWTESAVNAGLEGGAGAPAGQPVQFLTDKDTPEALQRDWSAFSFPHAALVALYTPAGEHLGALWISRDEPFTDSDRVVLARLGETYGHAWSALTGRRVLRRRKLPVRWMSLAAALLIFAAMFMPVRMSALAPAEIAATAPHVVAAPLKGVIKEILVSPNTRVEKGDPLFRFEAVDLRNEYNIAERRLDVARAALRKAQSGAFEDDASRARLAQLQAEVNLRSIERDYARERLDRVTVTAARSGLLVYSDPSDWEGRPVEVGQRVMQIVSPESVHVLVNLPVADAIVIEPGAQVEMFLDSDPLHPRQAELTSTSYVAEKTVDDVLAFPMKAELVDGEGLPRIGLEGTAKVYGEETSLFYYLFRRPIATLRQLVGF